MKVVMLGSKNECIILRNTDDVIEYCDTLQNSFLEEAARYLQYNVEPDGDEFDYKPTKTLGGIAFKQGLLMSQGYKNPLLEASKLVSGKTEQFFKHINNGETILININGGFGFLNENDVITDEYDYCEKVNNIKIVDGSKVIVLENDPDLDSSILSKYPDCSYVTRLKSVKYSELHNIFKRFLQAGGEKLYVITTLRDIEQFKLYMKEAIRAGIKVYEIELSANYPYEKDDIIKGFVNDKSIDFKITI